MFEGYTPETVDFLWGIRLNNNREWFLEHKQQYVKTLYEPTKALGAELFRPFVDKSGELLKVSRIYRDARMHHPLPYKESLWICIRRDVEWWAENPCLFFEINPDGMEYGFCLWKPRPATMKAFRRTIAQNPDAFLTMVEQAERKLGMKFSAECYKRPEACPDPRMERFYLWKSNIALIRHEDFIPELFGPDLKDRVGNFLEALIPIYEYFHQFEV
jgi:uncharacterized protein (TIGR02453 family)